jgi:hypothetical protein
MLLSLFRKKSARNVASAASRKVNAGGEVEEEKLVSISGNDAIGFMAKFDVLPITDYHRD